MAKLLYKNGTKKESYHDIFLMIGIASMLEPEVYMEVGLGIGRTFNAMSSIAVKSVGIDIKVPYNQIPKRDNITLFQGDSSQFVQSGWTGKVDLLFIDADHSEKKVLEDFHNLSPFVKEDSGLIFLHDTYPANKRYFSKSHCGTAWKAARRLHESYPEVEIVTIPGPMAGLSIARKVNKFLHWK